MINVVCYYNVWMTIVSFPNQTYQYTAVVSRENQPHTTGSVLMIFGSQCVLNSKLILIIVFAHTITNITTNVMPVIAPQSRLTF